MRKRLLIAVMLSTVLVGEGAIIYRAHSDTPTRGFNYISFGTNSVLNNYDLATSVVLNNLYPKDMSWYDTTYADVNDYIERRTASEESRRQLSEQRAKEREEFLKKQEAAAKELKELEEMLKRQEQEQAVQSIVISPEVPTPEPIPEPTPTPSVAQPNQSTATAEDTDYYGQFNATFICTCASCFRQDEWPTVSPNENFIWAPADYIPSGTVVTLDAGSTGKYAVRDGAGFVNGRNIIVFNSNHSEFGDGVSRLILYPKVTKG